MAMASAAMFAEGHKRTFLEVCAKSAIPPKADIAGRIEMSVKGQKRTHATQQQIAPIKDATAAQQITSDVASD